MSMKADGVRESRRKATMARDIVDQHGSGLTNRFNRFTSIVRDYPFSAVGIAFAAAFVAGFTLRRRQ